MYGHRVNMKKKPTNDQYRPKDVEPEGPKFPDWLGKFKRVLVITNIIQLKLMRHGHLSINLL